MSWIDMFVQIFTATFHDHRVQHGNSKNRKLDLLALLSESKIEKMAIICPINCQNIMTITTEHWRLVPNKPILSILLLI